MNGLSKLISTIYAYFLANMKPQNNINKIVKKIKPDNGKIAI